MDADAEDPNWEESPGMRTDEPGMRTDEPGMRTDEPGRCTDESGMQTDEPGMRTNEPGMWTVEPRMWADELASGTSLTHAGSLIVNDTLSNKLNCFIATLAVADTAEHQDIWKDKPPLSFTEEPPVARAVDGSGIGKPLEI